MLEYMESLISRNFFLQSFHLVIAELDNFATFGADEMRVTVWKEMTQATPMPWFF